MPQVPRTSYVDPTLSVTWSDGTAINGYFVIGVVIPVQGAELFASVAYGNQLVLEKLPGVYVIPIVDGRADQTSKVFYTSDIDPPAVKYVCWLYDRNWKQLFAPTLTPINTSFTVTTPTFTPSYTAPTVPTAGTTLPVLAT